MNDQVITINKYKLILFIIIFVVILYVVSALFNKADTPYSYDKYKNKLDILDNVVSDLHKQQIIIDKKIKSYKDSIYIFDNKIDSINKVLIDTRKYYGKKIQDITNFTPPQLTTFFTDRYK
jgi:lipopolysaccharide export LptBFGC system permease protein LptF